MGNIKKRVLDRLQFLSKQIVAMKEDIHTDVVVKPREKGPGIRAHKAVLAVKSKVLRNMLDCKLSRGKSIRIPDLNYEEFETLIKFLYCGTVNRKNKHIRSLYLAADKYDIKYLKDICRRLLISSLNLDNFYDIFELSNVHFDKKMKKSAKAFAYKNKSLIHTEGFESFAMENPKLGVEIARACVKKKKSRS